MGSQIAKACQERLARRVRLVGICDIDAAKAKALAGSLKKGIGVFDIGGLIEKSEFIVEAASASVSADILERCVKAGKDCLVMSVGGLLGRESLLEEARKKGVMVHIPSGAIAGIDGIKSGSAGRIDSVTLTTRKPPKGLGGAPYIRDNKIDLSNIEGEVTIFDGSAEEAVKGFPQNVNVSAVLSLAGIGSKKTRVKIVTSPAYTKNVHEVEVTGDFGTIRTRTENLPSSANPKTSSLAIYSAIATLEQVASSVRIGT